MDTGPGRTRLQRDADSAALTIRRNMGQEIGRLRIDAGATVKALARTAGLDDGYVHRIERGSREPSIQALSRVAAALGGELQVRIYPGTGPPIRDRWQARMLEGLLAVIHPRWARFVEVPIHRPIRGSIDLVLGDPASDLLVAAEFVSDLRRLEQTLRWSHEKAAALPRAPALRLARAHPDREPQVSTLLVVRSTRATRVAARQFCGALDAAYPAPHPAARDAIVGDEPWPGAAVLWMEADAHGARILERPPPGVEIVRSRADVRSPGLPRP